MQEEETGDLHNQDDVNPTSQLDKLTNNDAEVKKVKTDGTGAKRPVPTAGTVNIKKDEE